MCATAAMNLGKLLTETPTMLMKDSPVLRRNRVLRWCSLAGLLNHPGSFAHYLSAVGYRGLDAVLS